MLTGSLVLIECSPSLILWGCVSLCRFNILCPLYAPGLKHLQAYWSCAGMKGHFRRPPSQNQTQGIKAGDPGCLYYVSTSRYSICLCYSECMCIAVCLCVALTLASQVPELFPIYLNLTTLEIITWNSPSFKDFLALKPCVSWADRRG